MKKIISLIICAVVLCAFSVTAFADDDDDLLKDGKKYYNDATYFYLDGEYAKAAEKYHAAGVTFYAISGSRGKLLAMDAYYMAAKASELDNWPEHYDMYMGDADECWKYVQENSSVQYIQYYEVFGGIESALGSGFTLSTGNIAIIVGAASAIVFGVAGLIAGKTIGKKKALPKD